MLLAVDIGNTTISVGGFAADREPVFTLSLGAGEPRSADEYATLLRRELEGRGVDLTQVTHGAVASVVPHLTDSLVRALNALGCDKVLTVGAGVKTGISIRTDSPGEVGADIIANAAAAAQMTDGAAILVDLGTATTVFALNRKKELLGGAILPGIQASFAGLRRSTAQLPMVAPSKKIEPLGKNTADCIASGVVLGHAWSIDGLIAQYAQLLQEEPAVFVTGGLAQWVLPYCRRPMQAEPYLTLKGLRVIYEKTRKTTVM